MNYVFFDIECANCFDGNGKICSFGYVLTDRFFNIIKKEDWVINPKAPFMLRHKGKECIKLAYSKNEFRNAPDFQYFYRRIKALLTSPDNIVFGYASENDANFLRSECERYILPCINFTSYDVQRMLRYEIKSKNMISLASAQAMLGIFCRQEIHKSDDDSLMTLQVLKNLCIKYQTSPEQFIKKYPGCANTLKDYAVIIHRPEGRHVAQFIMGDHSNISDFGSDNYICSKRFIYNVKGNAANGNNSLEGKRIMLMPKFTHNHYRETVKLIQLIADCSGQVTERYRECDYYVYLNDYDELGNVINEKAIEEIMTAHPELIYMTIDELLDVIGISYDKFISLPTPNIGHLIDDSYDKIPRRHRPFKRKKSSYRNSKRKKRPQTKKEPAMNT